MAQTYIFANMKMSKNEPKLHGKYQKALLSPQIWFLFHKPYATSQQVNGAHGLNEKTLQCKLTLSPIKAVMKNYLDQVYYNYFMH